MYDFVDGLGWASSVVVSPDNAHVYISTIGSNSLVIFDLTQVGALEFSEVIYKGDPGIFGLGGAASVAITRDGNGVYVTDRVLRRGR